MKITTEVNGNPVKPEELGNVLMASLLREVKEQVRTRLEGIRDPDTGEFPAVAIRGDSPENLTLKVSGSDWLVQRVHEELGDLFTQEEEEEEVATDPYRPPTAFLCHASEDKALARSIAETLQANGIDTFFDEWEIGPGDSLRQTIEAGLGRCTHFIALLTPRSLEKGWVNTEMDSAFVRKVQGECKFIPLRSELPAEKLPELVQGLFSPSVEDYREDLSRLANTIHGVATKPPLGDPPPEVIGRSETPTGFSAAAEAIARLLVEGSENGDSMDPELEPDALRERTSLSDEEIVDAVDELAARNLVDRHLHLNQDKIGFGSIFPEGALFTELDKHFMDWDPEADALRVAADLYHEVTDGRLSQLGEFYGWSPRRLNPAVHYLLERDLVHADQSVGPHPWCCHYISRTPKTRRFVQAHS